MDAPGTGTARTLPKTAAEPDKMPDIEGMCARVSEIRATADRLQIRAREIELRLLGPMPVEAEGAAPAAINVPCLTGMIGADTREINTALREVGHSLDRIYQELGSIGAE